MEKVVDYNALKGGTLKRSIILLNQKLIKMLPEYFSQQQIGIIQHESFSEIVLRMGGQNMLENFISDLEKKLHVNILYASREEDGKVYRVVAYPSPVEDEMLVFYLSSTQYGIVDKMTVFIFDSIETMYYHLLQERGRIPKQQKDILEQESYSKMLSHFN